MRVDVPKTNNTQEVTIIEEDFIEQEVVKLLAKVKALLLEFKKQKQKDMILIPKTRALRNGGFVVRVDVP